MPCIVLAHLTPAQRRAYVLADNKLALNAGSAGDWAAVREYKVSGSNSYSKLVARYQQDLLVLHAASEAAQ